MILLTLIGCMTMDSFFFGGVTVDEYVLGGDVIPAADVEQVSFQTDDGWTDYGVWAHSEDPDAPVLVYFHGNADNIDHYWSRVEFYWQVLGLEVFIFDYRGFGKTGGDPTFDTLLDDADSAVRYVMDATGKPSEDLYYHGLSLGGCAAVHAAADYPPRALSTEDMFANLDMIVDEASDLDLPPGWFVESEWDNAAASADVHVPYLIMHGDADTYIDPGSAELVYAQANDPKVIWHPVGADHDETPDVDPDGYGEHLAGWIAGSDWPE